MVHYCQSRTAGLVALPRITHPQAKGLMRIKSVNKQQDQSQPYNYLPG